MKNKLFSLFFATLLSATSVHAYAWTVTTQGTIESGYDSMGIFGVANRNLQGLSFVEEVTVSTDPTQWLYSGIGPSWNYVQGTGPSFTTKVTVAGKALTFSTTSNNGGGASLENRLSDVKGYAYADKIDLTMGGVTSKGEQLTTQQLILSYDVPFVNSLSFNNYLNFQYGPQQSTWRNTDLQSSFSINNGQSNTTFLATKFSLTANGSVSTVPEPTTYLMMLAGLAVIAFAVTRQKSLSSSFA